MSKITLDGFMYPQLVFNFIGLNAYVFVTRHIKIRFSLFDTFSIISSYSLKSRLECMNDKIEHT